VNGTTRRFSDKVRFARGVEACLVSPVVPPSPLLLLRVRERVQLERLRAARRRDLFTWSGALALAVLVSLSVWLGVATRAAAWVRAAGAAGPVVHLAHTWQRATSEPLLVLLELKGPGLGVVVAILAVLLLLLLRDLFTDPLAGLETRRPHR